MPWNLPKPAPGGRPDELYVIDHLEETAEVVALGTNEDGITHPVMWTNRFGQGCVFSTTLAHLTATLADDTFLDVLANGIAWALGETEKPTPTPIPAEGVRPFP